MNQDPTTPSPHILYLHQYFRTPAEGGALRSWFLAEELGRQGARVEMVTAHNKATYERREVGPHLTVHYLPVRYDNRFGALARVRAFLAYAWGAVRLAGRLPNATVCFATSTPLTVGLVAWWLKRRRGLPYVFEVRDLWPEAPIQLGYVRAAPLRWALRKLERLIYDGARRIIALSPGMVAGVRASGTATPVMLVPNMADTARFRPAFAGSGGNEAPFIILYAGALGRANRVGFLLDAAEATQASGLAAVQFVVAGDGAEADGLRADATRRGLANVQFVGALNGEQLAAWRARAAASFTCFDTMPVLATNSPNKFFEGLACGALSVVTVGGWLRELVEQHACGFGYDPLIPTEFIAKLRPFVEDRAGLRAAQQRARQLAATQFSREKLAAQAARLILET